MLIKVIKVVCVSIMLTYLVLPSHSLSLLTGIKHTVSESQRSSELVSQSMWVDVSCEQALTLGSHNSVSLVH